MEIKVENLMLQHVNAMKKMLEPLPRRMIEQAGKKALDAISDYPLYAATSNISYEDAILIALVLGIEL